MTNTTDESRRAGGREPLAADFIIPLLACGLAIYYLATTTDLVWEARAAGVFVGVPLIAMCLFHMGRTLYRIVRGEGSFSAGDMFANTLFNRQRLALAALVAAFIVAMPVDRHDARAVHPPHRQHDGARGAQHQGPGRDRGRAPARWSMCC